MEETENLPAIIKKHLPGKKFEIGDVMILRESIDARKKNHVHKVLTVGFSSDRTLDLQPYTREQYALPGPHSKAPVRRPVVIGFGPCGIFAALSLALMGLTPLIIERGMPVETRDLDVQAFWEEGVLNEESNVQFGEGGAGAYSDGKLNTGTRDLRHQWILEQLTAAGAGPEILYRNKPHVGTDVLKKVLVSLRNRIIGLGGEIRFGQKVTDIVFNERGVQALELGNGDFVEASHVVLAIGHSARDTFEMLNRREIALRPKPFSVGVRIEHPQDWLNRQQYGDPELAGILGAAEYKLVHHCSNGRGLYSFCMCPGGEIISASSERGGVVVNGMSNHARNSLFANSGLLADVRVEDYDRGNPLDGVRFQRDLEQKAFRLTGSENRPPETTWKEFSENPDNPLRMLLPRPAVDCLLEGIPVFGKKLPGFDKGATRMAGVETRSSSPLRIQRDARGMSTIRGLYPAGEGAGYAGGILSAAADGIRIAEFLSEDMK